MYRVLLVLLVAAIVAATAGTIHGALPALLIAGSATVLALLFAAVLWNRPAPACAFAGLCLGGAFAASAIVLHGVDAPSGVAFAGLSTGDSAALVVGLAIITATALGFAFVRNAIARIAIALLGIYAAVPTLASVQHGGLRAALTDGLLAQTRGTYVAAEVLLPLAAAGALVFAVVFIARKRGAAAATAAVLALALLAGANVGAYGAGNVGLPTIAAFEHPAGTVPGPTAQAPAAAQPPSGARTSVPAATGASATATDLAKLGPESVDDGIIANTSTRDAASDAASALAPTEQSTAAPADPQKWRDLDNAVPQREYSLSALADSLSAEPGALSAFVRDNVGIDVYDGALRGPLGAWMNRAANPTDKLLLLAWLLAKKGVRAEFVRGTLSDAERDQIAQAATRTQPVVVPVTPEKDPDVARYFQTRVTAGEKFAASAAQQLGTVPLGSGAYTAARVPARHYWLRINRSGSPYDLDPTLAATKDGAHLGTSDASSQPGAAFPAEDYQTATVRFTQTNADGSTKVLAALDDRIANLAYSPIRIGILADAAPSTALKAILLVGSKPASTTAFASTGGDAPAQLVLEVRRRDLAGTTLTDRRVVYDKTRDGAAVRTKVLGLHTVMFAPGSAPMLFLHETYRNMISLSENVIAARNHTQPKFSGTYPQRIADYLTRDDVVAATLSGKNGIRLYRDRANVVELHTTAIEQGGDKFQYTTTFDIVDNGQNAVADGRAVVRANLARGWADTWIEKDLLGGTGAMTRLRAFEAQHVTLALVTKPGASTDPSRAGLDDGLAAGRIALAPASGGGSGFAWWEIDPATGTAVGRTTGGFGAEFAEYGLLLRTIQAMMFFHEMNEAAKECAPDLVSLGCAAAICALAVSALLIYSSAGHAMTGAALAKEAVLGKAGGLSCKGYAKWGESGHGGGDDP